MNLGLPLSSSLRLSKVGKVMERGWGRGSYITRGEKLGTWLSSGLCWHLLIGVSHHFGGISSSPPLLKALITKWDAWSMQSLLTAWFLLSLKSPLVSWPLFRCFSICLSGTEQCWMLSHCPELRKLPKIELHFRCLRPGWTSIHPSSIPTLPQAPRVHRGALHSSHLTPRKLSMDTNFSGTP